MNPRIPESILALNAAITAGDAETLRREMAFLDAEVRRLDNGIHPQLAHFLGNRSYAKAAMWVQGEGNIPRGICGGRAGE